MPKSGADITANKNDVLVVGPPKTGKTRILGTASRHEKLYILDLENGLTTIAGGPFEYDDCGDWEKFNTNFNWFMSNYKAKGYTALGIDSYSRAQRYLANHLMERDGTSKLTRDQFAEMLAVMRKIVDTITKNQDFTAIVLCHQELGNDSNYYPCLEGNIKYELSGYFDTVLHSKSGKDTNGKVNYWCELNNGGIGGTRLKHLRNKDVIPNDYKQLLPQ